MIELYAVYFKREKGALGLLFEMNYFLGFGIACYLIYLHQVVDNWASTVPAGMDADTWNTDKEQYQELWDWIAFQTHVVYAAIAVGILSIFCFWHMQR